MTKKMETSVWSARGEPATTTVHVAHADDEFNPIRTMVQARQGLTSPMQANWHAGADFHPLVIIV